MLLAVAGVLFGLVCFAALCVVAGGAALAKMESDQHVARLQAELAAAKMIETRDGFNYDRLAEAMARHDIRLAELRASRARKGLDVPAGRFGEHES